MASADSTGGDGHYHGSSFTPMLDGHAEENAISAGVSQTEQDELRELLREQDRFLPIANVARIMKKAIPSSGKISKEAKECCQECVSEFISFITSEASDRCSQEKRKTINGEDILYAMSTLGFDNYVEPLKQYLQKYRESTKENPRTHVTNDDPMFGEGNTIIATLSGDGSQGQNIVYGNYPATYISAAPLDDN